MKPALSIVFFTVASGAGLGLLALLALADLCPVPLLSPAALMRGMALALLLIAAGLASSVLHLAKPSNAWRAFARFRTSWLSREAVLAALLFPWLSPICSRWLWIPPAWRALCSRSWSACSPGACSFARR
jgi:DMSO reductase anchor subunit